MKSHRNKFLKAPFHNKLFVKTSTSRKGSEYSNVLKGSKQIHVNHLAPFVQKVDNAIHWINLYPLDSRIGFLILIQWKVIYPMDSTIHLLNNRGLCNSGSILEIIF